MRPPEPDPRVRAFPWVSLESTTRWEAAVLREASRWARHHTKTEAIASTASALLGARVEVLLRRARPLVTADPLVGGIAIRLVPADAGGHGILLEVEPSLATAVVARAVRRSAPVVVGAADAGIEALSGGLAAVVAATMRRVHAENHLRVATCGPAGEFESEYARAGGEPIAIAFTVVVGDEAFVARVVVSRDRLRASELVWNRRALLSLGDTPLAMPVVACAVRARVADVAALRVGDVFLPGTWKLERAGDTLSGDVLLSPPSAETGIRAHLADGGRLVLRGEAEAISGLREADMAESDETREVEGLVGAVGEVPVVVRIEVGEARMTAREWASLGRGDVLALGRRVGERVVLRVGGVPVARGDLVEIDGEVGVRITERLHEETTAA